MLQKYIRHGLLVMLFSGLLNICHADANIILSDSNFFYSGNDGRLVIEFHKPMGYIAHFPATNGRTLTVTLKELFASFNAGTIISDQLIAASKGAPPYTDISYEQQGNQNGTLTIHFNQPVQFSIQSSRDRKSLSITLQGLKKRSTPRRLSSDNSLPAYALQLQTSTKPIDPQKQPALKNFQDYDIYVSEERKDGKTIYTLSLGYFYSRSVAAENIKRLRRFYPSAWVRKIDQERREIADTWFYNTRLKRLAKNPRKIQKPDKLEQLMERARQAMIDKNYRQAIRLFTRIQQLGGGPYQKQTKELLGLARERNGQIAHARAEYQEYLKLYPEGEDAERVKQRLLGLLTARSRPREKLANDNSQTKEPQWSRFGNVFQFYRYQRNATDINDPVTTDNSLSSDFIYSQRKRGLDYSQRFDVALSHRLDLISGRDSSDGRINTLYYDIARRDGDYGGRIGRQSHNADGVLGRFDGMILNKRIASDKRINFLSGFPVDISTRDAVDTDRPFFALSIDLDALFLDTDVKLFALQQTNEGLTDRKAVGAQFKYIDDNRSLFATVDYDIFYSELNQATFISTWRNKANSSLSLFLDYRNSPLLTTNNALIGQTAQSIAELKQTYSDEEIYQLARDRSAAYRAVNLSASTQLAADYQLSGDFMVSKQDATVASGGVPATDGTHTEYFYSTSLIINNLFTSSDVTLLSLRYNDTTISDILQLSFSSNLSFERKWRISPRLVIENRDNSSGTSRTSVKPRLLVNYRASRNWKFELDTGYEDSQTDGSVTTQSENAFYISLGYIYEF